ncbi:MAG: TlyA family RNA methyltransferase [Lachnospiraceae bacterium]|nr:TlyA family RNA methyltransferase [Lachnospiraceae bacterium]
MKERLDNILVKRNLAPSREKARSIIMAGDVYVNGQKEDKAGTFFREEDELLIEIRGERLKYVSRGGLKLEKALPYFGIDVNGKVCLDIGASTGGFTDCMLRNGASKVYAVDVGHGQLDWSLRCDERVVCMEKTNFRYVKPEDIGEQVDLATSDVSFISLTKILPPAFPIIKDDGLMVCLIKPQFEAGKNEVGRKGVVRDPVVHESVIRKVAAFAMETGFSLKGITHSPIKGPEGNIEYLLFLGKGTEDDVTEHIPDTVKAAFEELGGKADR